MFSPYIRYNARVALKGAPTRAALGVTRSTAAPLSTSEFQKASCTSQIPSSTSSLETAGTMTRYGEEMVNRHLPAGTRRTVREEGNEKPGIFLDGSPILRRLGALESYQIALQTLDMIRGNVVSCRFALPKRLVPNARHHDLVTEFERAVARVVLDHPHMQVGIAGAKTSTPSWVRLVSINFRNLIKWQTVQGGHDAFQKELQQTLNQEADTRFSEFHARPGWRIRVLRSEADLSFIEVLLTINHAHLDGASCKTFYRELLTHLHASDSGLHASLQASLSPFLSNRILTLSPASALAASLPPPPESIVPFPVNPTALEHFVKQEVETPSSRYPRNIATHAHWAPIQLFGPDTIPFKSHIRTMSFPQDIAEQLVQACREQGVTLTTLLHGVTLVSLATMSGPATKADAFAFLTPMDIRRFLPSLHTGGNHGPAKRFEAESAMGNYVTVVEHVADAELVGRVRRAWTELKSGPGSDFQASLAAPDAELSTELQELIFTAARRVRADLTAKSEACSTQGLENDMIGFLSRGVSDWRRQLQEETKRPRKSSWVVTNLGAMEPTSRSRSRPRPRSWNAAKRNGDSETAQDGDGWSIIRMGVTMCANVVAPTFGIAVASVRGGDLVVSVTWQEGVVDEQLGEAFVMAMERWLRLMAGWKKRKDEVVRSKV